MRFPGAAPEALPGVRRFPIRDFPYGIFYRTEPDRIAVLAVYHASRVPNAWRQRGCRRRSFTVVEELGLFRAASIRIAPIPISQAKCGDGRSMTGIQWTTTVSDAIT